MERKMNIPNTERVYYEHNYSQSSIRGVFERLQSDSFSHKSQNDASNLDQKPKTKVSIEEMLRNKYAKQSPMKRSITSANLQSPRLKLEEVLAVSRFVNKSHEQNKNPRQIQDKKIAPKQAEISLQDLAKNIEHEEKLIRKSSQPRSCVPNLKLNLPVSQTPQKINKFIDTPLTTSRADRNNSILIEKLRDQVRARPKILEHEEPPDLLEMDMLSRNQF